MGQGVVVTYEKLPKHWDGAVCSGECDRVVSAGDLVVTEETEGKYLDRVKVWHRQCYPAVVDRILNAAVKRWKKRGYL